MIAASFKRFWPQDRLARLRSLQGSAHKLGIILKARNGGTRTVFLPYIAFWGGETFLAHFWNISEAEDWFHKRIVERIDAADKALEALRPGGAA